MARILGPTGEPDTFVVRRANGGWRLEGRYAAFVPTTRAQAGQDDLTADQLRAGLADGSLTGRVIVIDGELEMMQVPCPKPGACAVPNLTKLGGVPITVDPAIEALVANDVPDGPHVFIGDGVGLTYLGTMTGAVDPPMTVAQLWAVSPAVDETGIRFVEGIVGPIPCVGCPTESDDASGPLAQWHQRFEGRSGAGVRPRHHRTAAHPRSLPGAPQVRIAVRRRRPRRPACVRTAWPSTGGPSWPQSGTSPSSGSRCRRASSRP